VNASHHKRVLQQEINDSLSFVSNNTFGTKLLSIEMQPWQELAVRRRLKHFVIRKKGVLTH
jgi:hypothetical protein